MSGAVRAAARVLRAAKDPQRPKLLLVDFDGTLSPIVKDYTRAKIGAGFQSVLNRLHRRGWIVAVISGRGLADLRRRIRVDEALYGGEHGWDWKGASRPIARALPTPQERSAARRFVRRAVPLLRSRFKGIPGVQIQEKRFFAVVHYRLVPQERMRDFLRTFRALRHHPRFAKGRWRHGKKIWELLGPVRWGKGSATRLLVRLLRPSLTVAAGDDSTDEDMFRAIRPEAGITIRIGDAPTCAQYRLDTQPELLDILRRLAELK